MDVADARPGSASGPDRIRVGVVIAVPEPFGHELQEAREGYGDPDARAIPPHVTLLAPTDIDREAIDEVTAHLADVAWRHAPFTMHLRGSATFRPVSPVVFVQVAQGIAECEQLERAIRCGPLAVDVRFSYHPHVTVAHDVSEDALNRAFDEMAGFEASFAVEHFDLYIQKRAPGPAPTGGTAVWRHRQAFALGETSGRRL